MSACLIRANSLGIIEHVYFDGLGLGSKSRNVYNLFSSNDEKFITAQLKTRENFTEKILKSSTEEALLVYFYPFDQETFIYIIKENKEDNSRKIIHSLLQVISEQTYFPKKGDANQSQYFFENIQRLNNELINKSREIEKINSTLNNVNKILNNRLVKDPLTDLTSRYQYRDEMLHLIKETNEQKGLFCFIDLDNFKTINDTHGHATGDEYLKIFADRLKTLPYQNSVKMRISGDEFGLFIGALEEITDATIAHLWETIKAYVLYDVKINNLTLPLSLSMGVAIFKEDTTDIHLLIDYADFAMYQAKNAGKNQYKLFCKKHYEEQK